MPPAASEAKCPVAHSSSSTFGSDEEAVTYVIVVERGRQPEIEGFIVPVSSGDSDLSQFRHDIASRSTEASIIPSAVELLDSNGNPLETIKDLLVSRIAYLARPLVGRRAPDIKGYPILGVVPLIITPKGFRYEINKFFEQHGDTVGFSIMGAYQIATRDPLVAAAIMNDSEYFYKGLEVPNNILKDVGGDGLVTTSSKDAAWKLSHRVLLPAFSASAMKIYGEEMIGCAQDASKLVESFGADHSIDVLAFTTNIAFQTVGKVGLGYDFKTLDPNNKEQHEFLTAMEFCLGQVVSRSFKPRFWKHLPLGVNYQFDANMDKLKAIINECIDQRRNSPDATNMKKDLLGYMLNARAPDEDDNLVGLSDDLIFDQILTLGIAGYETSANTMAWALYLLDKHPDIQQKVVQELANVGITPDSPPTIKQVTQLKYMVQVLKEILRVLPPVPLLSKTCDKTCILPGGYKAFKDESVVIHCHSLHHNPKTFPDPYKFDPERFNEENIKKIPEGGYLPFSSGARACIGMQFAMMEMRVVLATLLSRFVFTTIGNKEVPYDPVGATAKPLEMFMTAVKRDYFPKPNADISALGSTASNGTTFDLRSLHPSGIDTSNLPAATIVFGSNMGVSEDYAVQMSEKLKLLGYADVAVKPLDDWDYTAAKPADGKKSLVIVITSTYNGVPPDNANKFAKAIAAESRTDLLKGVDYLVFGCGNTMWRTFQKFPRFVYERLGQLGASPLADFQHGDSNDDLDEDYLQWSLRTCTQLVEHYGSNAGGLTEIAASKELPFSLKFVADATAAAAPFRIAPENASIKVNHELQDVEKSGRSTRHIEITLSESSGIAYQTGDHLNIYPANSASVVREVAAILQLVPESVFSLEQTADAARYSRSAAAAIKGQLCTVADAIQHVCDWKEAPSRDLVVALSSLADDSSADNAKVAVLRAAAEAVNTSGKQSAGWTAFLAQHRTVLDVLRSFASLAHQLPFGSLLHYVNAMTPRRYSIASCQRVVDNEVHISAAIVNDVANGHSYGGLATEYLASLEAGAPVSVSHRPAQAVFHLPESSDTPVVFVGAGTGLAPFRGFLQERQGAGCAQTELYFGCRSPEYDYLYKSELESYLADGTLTKFSPVFSRIGNACKYVQHQIIADGARIWDLVHKKNGRIYVCGSADKLARDMVATMLRIFEQVGGLSAEDAKTYLNDLVSSGRYVEDVW